jgi:hypothetical protein
MGRPAGLPKASTAADDDSWSAMEYLKVPLEDVQASFERYGLLDDRVRFHRGYFRDSLPPLREELLSRGGAIALLRMGAAPAHRLHSPPTPCSAALVCMPCRPCQWQQSRQPSTS